MDDFSPEDRRYDGGQYDIGNINISLTTIFNLSKNQYDVWFAGGVKLISVAYY